MTLMKSRLILSVVLPFALCVASLDPPRNASDFFTLVFTSIANLPFAALPQWVTWWFAAKVDASHSPAFLGGLIAGNLVLAFFVIGFGEHGAELVWVFYWPLSVGAIWAGYFVGERIWARK